ncbi:MAG: Tad domain-containing protein [Chloroflexota bacterium]
MKRNASLESGQVMVLLAFGFVVLLGFLALALDGGMAYSDRRYAQNVADASSLAGGGAAALSIENSHVYYSTWNCADSRIVAAQNAAIQAAVSRAANNKFTIAGGTAPGANVVTAVCGQEMLNGFMDKYIDITTYISKTTDTNFMQLFYGGELINNVQAVTRVRPRSPLAFGHAVVATGTEACSGNSYGVIVGGSSTTLINGGGIWSNGCLGINGNSYHVNVTNGGIGYGSDMDGNPGNMNPAPVQSPPMSPDKFTVPAPDCSHPDAINVSGGSFGGSLSPGLYCVTGDVRINAHDSLTGSGVTIYLVSGDLTINGGATVNIEAPDTSPDPKPAIGGVLIYAAVGDIDLEGNATSAYLGLVYAPNGQIKAHGSNGTTPTFNTQLVGHTVDISGNANIDINFNPEKAYKKPSTLELYK